MRIRFLKLAAGPGGVFGPGHEGDFPAPVAQGLIDAGAAIPIKAEPETAVVKDIEVMANDPKEDNRPNRRTNKRNRGKNSSTG